MGTGKDSWGRRSGEVSPTFAVDSEGALIPDGSASSPLSKFRETYRLATASRDWLVFLRQSRSGRDSRSQAALVGDLQSFAIPDLIGFLAQSRWTGVMAVSGDAWERRIVFKEGEVRAAYSDVQREQLDRLLVRLGYVDLTVVEDIAQRVPQARLGRALVEQKILASHDLFRCLKEQIAEVFHGIVTSSAGSFCLVKQPIDDVSHDYNLALSAQGLLMDSIRRTDEAAHFRTKIPHSAVVVSRVKVPNADDVTQDEALVFSKVNGRRTIAELGKETRQSEFDTTKLVFRLLEGGYVQVALDPPVPKEEFPKEGPERIVEVYNSVFRAIREAVLHGRNASEFSKAANAGLQAHSVSASPVLEGLSFGAAGDLDSPSVLLRYEKLQSAGRLGADPLRSLARSMGDVTLFLLFEAAGNLSPESEEALSMEVKRLQALLDTP